jgi:peptidoglycan/xylan/chitin deacetylase (PgdA/CDA1 family)
MSSDVRLGCFSVDLEQDRAPDTTSWRGVTEGLPDLLALLAELEIRATFFVTGESARRFPGALGEIVAAGHEIGSHGDQHVRFDRLSEDQARRELGQSIEALSRHASRVVSFRAPYMRLPERFLPLLTAAGLRVDSSEGRYKSLSAKPRFSETEAGPLARMPASVTPGMLQWPAPVRDAVLHRAGPPLVLYVHPWEIVDFADGEVRRPARFPGRLPSRRALPRLRAALAGLRGRGTAFMPLAEIARRWFAPASPASG